MFTGFHSKQKCYESNFNKAASANEHTTIISDLFKWQFELPFQKKNEKVSDCIFSHLKKPILNAWYRLYAALIIQVAIFS